MDDFFVNQLGNYKRFEQFQSHALGQAALVQIQIRINHDDAAAGVINSFAQQILPEAALFAF